MTDIEKEWLEQRKEIANYSVEDFINLTGVERNKETGVAKIFRLQLDPIREMFDFLKS